MIRDKTNEPIKYNLLFFYILLILSLIGFAWADHTPPTNVKNLIDKLKSADSAVRRDSAESLVKLGPNAVPSLGAALRGKDDDLAGECAILLGEIGTDSIPVLVNVLNDKQFLSNPRRIKSIVNALGNIGPDAVPLLVHATADEKGFNLRTLIIMQTLNEIGPPAIPGLTKSLERAPVTRRFIVAIVLRDLNDVSTVPISIKLLNDEYREVRSVAANALQKLGQKAKDAVPALIRATDVGNIHSVKQADSLKWEPYENFRGEAIAALGTIAPDSREVFEILIKALNDKDPAVRNAAATTLGKLGKKAEPAVPNLIKALKDMNGQVRKNVVAALGSISPKAEGVLTALIEELNEKNPAIRAEVAKAFGQMREDSNKVMPKLIQMMGDSSGTVRIAATNALGQIGKDSKTAVPFLITALKDKDERVRRNATRALANIGPGAQDAAIPLYDYLRREAGDNIKEAIDALRQIGPAAINTLIKALQDQNPIIRQYAAQALGQLRPKMEDAVPSLIGALKDENPMVRRSAIEALGNLESKAIAAVPALCQSLVNENSDIRLQAVNSLGRIGPAAKASVPILVDSLKSVDINLRTAAANALGSIGPDAVAAVPHLIESLRSKNLNSRTSAVIALGGIGPAAKEAVPDLILALKDENTGLRHNAIIALGKIGAASRTAIPALVEILNDDPSIGGITADALVDIAGGLLDGSSTDSISELKKAYSAIDAKPDLLSHRYAKQEHARFIKRVIEQLELIRKVRIWQNIVSWSIEHPGFVVLPALYLLSLFLFLSLFWLKPLVLLRFNDALAPCDINMEGSWIKLKFSLRSVLWVAFLCNRTRVLDAWVQTHIHSVRKSFLKKETVINRQIHIPMPVYLDGNMIIELSGKDLRPTFKNHIGCLLIWEEGGAGKTSLACQVAKWAMAEEEYLRIAKHHMLPVLIEDEIVSDSEEETDSLDNAIRRQLQILCDSPKPISEELLDNLLRRQRILVIIDHLSEMTAATQAKIQLGASNFSSNALIVTSRLNENLGNINKTVIKPLRIASDRLVYFMSHYLTECNKGELFPDKILFPICGKLSEMVGDRQITVLLAKLYTDQMILLHEGKLGGDNLNTIPDLMTSYLNEINRGVIEERLDDRTLHRVAEIIAWECLKQHFWPAPAQIDDICNSLGGNDALNQIIYLENRLRLIKRIEPAQDRIRFLLDPLAEYLAGLYLVNTYAANEDRWRQFLDYGANIPGAPETIKGFLLAVRDCCVARQPERNIPSFVVEELNVRVHVDNQ